MKYKMLFGKSGANVGTSLETIKKGDILLLNGEKQVALQAGNKVSDCPNLVIVGCVKDGYPITLNSTINLNGKDKLVSVAHVPYRAQAFKKAVIGYDRVADSGAFTVTSTSTSSRNFKCLVAINDKIKIFPNGDERYEAYSYVPANVAADKYKILADFAKQINGPHSFNPTCVDLEQPVVVRVTTAETGATSITGTVDVVNGHQYATCSTKPAFTVGNYLILDKVAYKVEAINDKVVKLDRKFSEATKRYATTEAKYIATIGAVGLEIEEQAVPRIDVLSKPATHGFDIAVISEENNSMEAIQAKVLTQSDLGSGSSWAVEMLENRAMNVMANVNMRDKTVKSVQHQVIDGVNYDLIELDFNFTVTDDIDVNATEDVAVVLAIPTGTAQIAAIKAQLAGILGSVGLSF